MNRKLTTIQRILKFLRDIFAPRVIHYHVYSKEMKPEQKKEFNKVFENMDKTFEQMDRTFKSMEGLFKKL